MAFLSLTRVTDAGHVALLSTQKHDCVGSRSLPSTLCLNRKLSLARGVSASYSNISSPLLTETSISALYLVSARSCWPALEKTEM